MAIACTENSQTPLIDLRFKLAAFISFFCLILYIYKAVTGIFFSFHQLRTLSYTIDTSLTIASLTGSIYILVQLKRLLVERYHIHNISNLINFVMVIQVYVPLVIFFTRMSLVSAHNTDATGTLIVYGAFIIPGILLFGTISIFIGKRLLKIKDRTSDLYRTYAILSIIEGVCIFTIILIPVFVLSRLVSAVVLGIIFLKESETEPVVEFV